MRPNMTVDVDALALTRLAARPTVPLEEWIEAVAVDLRLLKELGAGDPALEERWDRLRDLLRRPLPQAEGSAVLDSSRDS
jgi:hypothetical protein